ncbi:MAG: hypothetical protein KFKLKKLM_00586 [Flavobacteriales bacterium]|nr:hypothetical protein [Flavobacteriales bacterium]
MFAVIGAVVVFVAVKEAISPVPLAAKPMLVLSFVQSKVVPVVGLVKFVAETVAALQTMVSIGTTTVGVGFTVMMYVDGIPTQLLAVGITVMFAVIGAVVVLVAVKEAISPVPFAAKPIVVLSFVQSKVAPVVGLVKFVAETVAASQIMVSVGTTTVGVGFTVIV